MVLCVRALLKAKYLMTVKKIHIAYSEMKNMLGWIGLFFLEQNRYFETLGQVVFHNHNAFMIFYDGFN
jgi:hypothetical protein